MNVPHVLPFQFAYDSELAPGAGEQAVAAIAAVSSERNLALGISGALLFDGERFCQLLEGPELDIRLLIKRIVADARHRHVSVTVEGYFGLPRLTTGWRLGRCDRSALEPLLSKPRPKGEVALAQFMSALASAAPSGEPELK